MMMNADGCRRCKGCNALAKAALDPSVFDILGTEG